MDEHGNIYASTSQEVGVTHHSSLLGGRNVVADVDYRAPEGS